MITCAYSHLWQDLGRDNGALSLLHTPPSTVWCEISLHDKISHHLVGNTSKWWKISPDGRKLSRLVKNPTTSEICNMWKIPPLALRKWLVCRVKIAVLLKFWKPPTILWKVFCLFSWSVPAIYSWTLTPWWTHTKPKQRELQSINTKTWQGGEVSETRIKD